MTSTHLFTGLCLVMFFMIPMRIIASQGETDTLNITDYGILPNSGKDACLAVRTALEKARSLEGAVILHFPKGRYDFYKQTADTTRYMVSGIHQCWDFTIAIHLKDQKNITLSGDSSTFLIHGEMTPIAIVNSENVLIKDIIVDHIRPNVSEFQVVDVGENWMDVQIHPDSKYHIDEQGGFWWINADGETYKAGTAQWFDPQKDITRRTWDPSKVLTRSEETSNGNVKFYFSHKPETRIGLIYQTRFAIRKNQGALIYKSIRVEWRDVTVRFSPGLGFLSQFSKDLTFRRVKMEPDPASGRTCASFADGFHLCGSSGNILVESCRLVGLQDDHMNMYGNQMMIEAKEGPRTIRASFSSKEQQCDIDMFAEGDEITLNDPLTLLPVIYNRVVKTEWAEKMHFLITLEKEIEGEVEGMILENRTKIPDLVEIRNNYLGRVPTRSILMYSSRKSVIENNIFHRAPMPAILIKTPDPPYNLQGNVEDLTIGNNVFYECGELAEQAVIALNPQANELDYKKPVYKNIKIVNNMFIQKETEVPLLRALGSKGILFQGNRVELVNTDQPLLSFTSCANVIVKNNLILNSQGPYKIDFLNASPREIQVIPADNWRIKMADIGQ